MGPPPIRPSANWRRRHPLTAYCTATATNIPCGPGQQPSPDGDSLRPDGPACRHDACVKPVARNPFLFLRLGHPSATTGTPAWLSLQTTSCLCSCCFFLAGLVGTAFLFRKPAGHRAWKLADLVWVVLGGFGALVAVISGIYAADSSKLERQIDIAYAATAAF